MKRFCLAALMILGMAGAASATDKFYSQSGGGTGASCASTHSLAQLNANSDGLGAADFAHLCSSLSTSLTVPVSGTTGNPFTVIFESGASFTAAFWATGAPAITIANKNFVTIDGGTNGVIQATDNGNNGQGNDQPSLGIENSESGNTIIKNLSFHNLYIQQPFHNYTGGCGTRVDSAAISVDGGSHFRATNNTFDHVRIGIGIGTSNSHTDTDYEVDHNALTFVEVHVGGASGSFAGTNFRIHNNHFGGGTWIYDTPNGCYHHEATHFFGSGSPYPDQIYIYNNLVDGIWGQNGAGVQDITAAFFSEFVGPTVVYFNNIVDWSTATIEGMPDNGYFFCKGDGTIDGNNHCKMYNNTIVSLLTFGTDFEAQLGASQLEYQNNIGVGADGPDDGGGGYFTLPNNNSYYVASGSITFHITGGATNFSGWQGIGADLNGINGSGGTNNPGTYVGVSYIPPGGSPVIGLGANLTSLCSGNLVPLCSDKNGAARPTGSTHWDSGAINSGTAPPSNPTVPTSIMPTTLAAGTVGVPYPAVAFQTVGGKAPYSYTITGAPPGVPLLQAGIPTLAGAYFPLVKATDALGHSVAQNYTISILPAVIVPPPTLTATFNASTSALTFSSIVGTNPACQVVTIGDSSPSGQHIPFAIAQTASWIGASGQTQPLQTAEKVNVCPLAAGVQNGSVTISATGPSSGGYTASKPISFTVALTLTPPPTISKTVTINVPGTCSIIVNSAGTVTVSGTCK